MARRRTDLIKYPLVVVNGEPMRLLDETDMDGQVLVTPEGEPAGDRLVDRAVVRNQADEPVFHDRPPEVEVPPPLSEEPEIPADVRDRDLESLDFVERMKELPPGGLTLEERVAEIEIRLGLRPEE